jgi:hypothetical protein
MATDRQVIRGNIANDLTDAVAKNPEGYLRELHNADLGQRNRLIVDGRIPLILTCLSWQARGRAIEFWVNPSSITWNFKLRGATTKVKGGTISYTWRDGSRGSTFHDEPRMNITFQTGNASPIYTNDLTTASAGQLVGVPPGVLDLYDCLELMNEPLVLDDGTMNYRIISYNSIIFPELILYGFFDIDQGMDFSENADDPAHTTWQQTFIIRKSIPNYVDAAALAKTFSLRSEEYLTGTGESQTADATNDLQAIFDSGTNALVPSSFSDPILRGAGGLTEAGQATQRSEDAQVAYKQAIAASIKDQYPNASAEEQQRIIDGLDPPGIPVKTNAQKQKDLQAVLDGNVSPTSFSPYPYSNLSAADSALFKKPKTPLPFTRKITKEHGSLSSSCRYRSSHLWNLHPQCCQQEW